MSRVAGDAVADDRAGREQQDDPSPTSRRPGRGQRLHYSVDDRVLVAIVVLGAFLRFWGLGRQSIWFDEWLTSEASSGSVVDLFRHVLNREGAAPPYFLGMWAWTQVAGRGAVSLRLLPALGGVATIPAVYAALRLLVDERRVARVAALLVAVNPMLVWYSQEARPYALVALAAALSLWGYARVRVHPEPSRADWLVWGLACAGAIALHYVAACLVAAEAVALYRQRPEQRRRLGRACIPTAVVVGVLAPFALVQRSRPGYPDWVTGWPVSHRLENAVRTAFVGPSAPDTRLWLVGLAAVVVAAVVLVVRASRREQQAAVLLTGFGLVVVVVAIAGVVVGVDGVLARYLIAALVPLLAALGIGLGSPRAGRIGLGVVLALVAVSIFTVGSVTRDPDLQKPDWRAVADTVDSPGQGTRVLVINRHAYLAQPLLDLVAGAQKMKRDGAEDVTEIDVLFFKGLDAPCDWLVGRACGLVFMGGPLPPDVADDVVLVERVDLDQFVVERYRTAQPLDLDVDDLLLPTQQSGLVFVFR